MRHRPRAAAVRVLSVKGWLGELRARDLRFSLEEARRFFAGASVPALSETAIELVHARAEGWVAVLRLVAPALRDAGHRAGTRVLGLRPLRG